MAQKMRNEGAAKAQRMRNEGVAKSVDNPVNHTTQSLKGGERKQRPKPGVSKPTAARPDHKREEISDAERKKKSA